MLINNLRFTLRRLNRYKLTTFLHLTGLTLGIMVCLIIALFVHHELSFDTYHEKADRIFRFNQVWIEPSGERDLSYGAPAPLGEVLKTEIPEIETVVSVFPRRKERIEISPEKKFNQEGILFVEPTFLDVFDVEVIEGNGHEALRKPWHTLLTASTAKKFFGRENPIGKTITYDDEHTLTVAGIIKDFPNNTHLPATMLVPYPITKEFIGFNPNQWGLTFGASTYAVLKEGSQPADLMPALQTIYDEKLNNDEEDPEKASVAIQPLTHIHLEPEYGGGGRWVKAINPSWLWFFSLIGLIVLGLACINFINLTTAQSLIRAKEVGLRKAIGAERGQLIRQFIWEAALLIFAAAIMSIVLAQFALPYVNQLLDKKIIFDYLYTPKTLVIFLIGISLLSLLTGIYPAWLTSKFQPAIALKSKAVAGNRSSSFMRKGLVVTQFTISGVLLIALLLISEQMELFYTKNLGFDKDNIVSLSIPDKEKRLVFEEELNKIAGVKNITFTSSTPSMESHNSTNMHLSDLNQPDRKSVAMIFGDENYPELFNLSLKAGRFFNISDTSATSASLDKNQRFPKVIVNEKLIQELGYPSKEAALGQRFKAGWNNWQPEIVGVVENFVTGSLREDIKPALIMQYSRYYYNSCIKIEANSDMAATLAGIRRSWERVFPDHFYNYTFLDERIAQYYTSESRLLQFFKIFAGLAMLISCLGLWGLATFAALQRTKEIGIRKVLGASTESLVSLLSKDFLKLVGIALIIAIPIAWYGMDQWLNNFAFRIEIEWWVFVMAALAAIIIAFFTVSFQSIRTALANPIDSLGGE
jgi:ABC-type antimicrobial peptide transport system permease subunit